MTRCAVIRSRTDSSAVIGRPLLAWIGPASGLTKRQRYSSLPASRLATRNGSSTEASAISEKRGRSSTAMSSAMARSVR